MKDNDNCGEGNIEMIFGNFWELLFFPENYGTKVGEEVILLFFQKIFMGMVSTKICHHHNVYHNWEAGRYSSELTDSFSLQKFEKSWVIFNCD